jgi:hypothetical protein
VLPPGAQKHQFGCLFVMKKKGRKEKQRMLVEQYLENWNWLRNMSNDGF